jgi:chromate transport protein ChrA
MRSIDLEPWFSVADTSCCRSCERRWSSRGGVSDGTFLAGYGAAQAVPGPLFTFAAYLGAASNVGPGGVIGAMVALAGIFLPGLLALMGTLPFWHIMRSQPRSRATMEGVNAAVVGLLGRVDEFDQAEACGETYD